MRFVKFLAFLFPRWRNGRVTRRLARRRQKCRRTITALSFRLSAKEAVAIRYAIFKFGAMAHKTGKGRQVHVQTISG